MSYKTEREAREAGEKLLAQMYGEGWTLRVWENLGWHISVINWPVAVYEASGRGETRYFSAMTDDPNVEIVSGTPAYLAMSGSFLDPNQAVRAHLSHAEGVAHKIEQAVKVGKSIMVAPDGSGDASNFVEALDLVNNHYDLPSSAGEQVAMCSHCGDMVEERSLGFCVSCDNPICQSCAALGPCEI